MVSLEYLTDWMSMAIVSVAEGGLAVLTLVEAPNRLEPTEFLGYLVSFAEEISTGIYDWGEMDQLVLIMWHELPNKS